MSYRVVHQQDTLEIRKEDNRTAVLLVVSGLGLLFVMLALRGIFGVSPLLTSIQSFLGTGAFLFLILGFLSAFYTRMVIIDFNRDLVTLQAIPWPKKIPFKEIEELTVRKFRPRPRPLMGEPPAAMWELLLQTDQGPIHLLSLQEEGDVKTFLNMMLQGAHWPVAHVDDPSVTGDDD